MSKIVIRSPLIDWNIIVTVQNGHTGDMLSKVTFKKLTELREYFFKSPALAANVGYVIGKYKRSSARSIHGQFRVQLFLEYYAEGVHNVLQFTNIDLFVATLQEHPALANAVGYTKRSK